MSGDVLFFLIFAAGFIPIALLAEAANAEERGWEPLYKVWFDWFREKWDKIRKS